MAAKSCVRINQFHSNEMNTKKAVKKDEKLSPKSQWMIRNHDNKCTFAGVTKKSKSEMKDF